MNSSQNYAGPSVVAHVLRESKEWIETSALTYANATAVATLAVAQAQGLCLTEWEARHHTRMAVIEAVCDAGPKLY